MRLPTAQSDPSGVFGAIGTTAGAILALLVILGILDGETAEALLAVVVTIGPLAVAFGIRRHAWAPTSVETAADVSRRGVDPGDDASGRAWVHPDQLPERRRIASELDKLTTAEEVRP